jgi:4-amino-4-deoxychorismate lyase
MGYHVKAGDFQLDSLYEAQELFICNSLLGVAPVTQIAGTSFKTGTITRDIQERLGQW